MSRPFWMNRFLVLRAWMKRWGVLSPDEQRDFLEREDVAEMSWINGYFVCQAVEANRDPADILIAATELTKEAPLSRVLGKGLLRWPGFCAVSIVLFLIYTWIVVPVIVVAAYVLAISGFFRPRKITKLESKYNWDFGIGDPPPDTWERLSVSKFDMGNTTDVHPQERYSALRDSERCCCICSKSPPAVWLTVVKASKKLDANIPVPVGHVVHREYRWRLLYPDEVRVICTGCWSQV